MKILITGGVGFVGGHLAESLLLLGHNVDLLDNFQRGVNDAFVRNQLLEKGARIIEVNLLDITSLSLIENDYDHIYHLAAIIGVDHVLNRPYEVLVSNTVMTDNALTIARRQKTLKRFIFSSTSEVYAGTLLNMDMPIPTPESTPIVLTDLKQPRTSYMLSKLYGEAMCNQSGIPTTIVRLHNVYGPRMGMSHVIPELLKKAWSAKDGDSLNVYSIDHMRTFCYVGDAVEMMVRLASAEAAVGETINIGNESPEIKIGDLADLIIKTVGRKIEIIADSTTPGSPSRRCPKTTLLEKITDFKGKVSLKDGIQKTYDWYLDNIFLGKGISAK